MAEKDTKFERRQTERMKRQGFTDWEIDKYLEGHTTPTREEIRRKKRGESLDLGIYVVGATIPSKEERIENQKKKKQEKRLQEKARAEAEIKKSQAEIDKFQQLLDNGPKLTKEQKRYVKCKIKLNKSIIFEYKHPVLNTMKEMALGVVEFFGELGSGLMEINSAAYDHVYGGEGYTKQDKDAVRDALNHFGPVAADATRARIRERIENESQPGNE